MLIVRFFVAYVICSLLTSIAFAQPGDRERVPAVKLVVVDADGKPVEDATVSVEAGYGEREATVFKTNKNGQTAVFSAKYVDPKKSLFTIEKDGFYQYRDLGLFVSGREMTVVRVELIRKPLDESKDQTQVRRQRDRDFFLAAKSGDAPELRRLLKLGADANLVSRSLRGVPIDPDMPVIYFAARSGNADAVSVLLDAGARSLKKASFEGSVFYEYLHSRPFGNNWRSEEKLPADAVRKYEEVAVRLIGANFPVRNSLLGDPEFKAAERGLASVLELLFKSGAKPDAKYNYGQNLLFAAAHGELGFNRSNAAAVKLLLSKGVAPRATVKNSGYCVSPLTLSARRGDAESVSLLLGAGASLNDCGQTETMSEAARGGDIATVELLFAAQTDKANLPAFNRQMVGIAVKLNRLELLQHLLAKGFEADSPYVTDRPLSTAINGDASNRAAIIDALIKAGADPNRVDGLNTGFDNCFTALMLAVAKGDTEVSAKLLKAGANVNFVCKNGRSALTEAVLAKLPSEMIEFLIENGIDVKGLVGAAATDWLASNRHYRGADEMRSMLESKGARNASKALIAAQSGDLEMFEKALREGGDVNFANSLGVTPLIAAARFGNEEIARRLIEKGANVNARDAEGMTPLMFAALGSDALVSKNVALVRMLLDAGADPNVAAVGFNGPNSRKTALFLASWKGNTEIVKMLIAKGADVNFDCGDGDSALGVAVRGTNTLAMIKVLFAAGIDPNSRIAKRAVEIAGSLYKNVNPNQPYNDIIGLFRELGVK